MAWILLSSCHRFSIGFRSQLCPTQSSTSTSLSANHSLMLRAVWQGAPSYMKTVHTVILRLALRCFLRTS